MIRKTCIATAVPLALIATAPAMAAPPRAATAVTLSALSYEFVGSSVVADETGHSQEQVIMRGRARAVGDRVRIDIDDAGSASNIMRGAYLLLSDGGRRMTWVSPSYRQYYETDPESMFGGMDMLTSGANGFVTMEASNVHVDAQRLGSGPVIQGHSTVHYRLRQRMDMKTRVLYKSSLTHDESIIDYYYATDLPAFINPFVPSTPSLPSNGGMLGADYTRQMRSAIDKLAQGAGGAPLRTIASTKTVDESGKVRSSVLTTEVSNIKQIEVNTNLFEVPVGYSKILPPQGMTDPSGMQVGSAAGVQTFGMLQSIGHALAALDPLVISRTGHYME